MQIDQAIYQVSANFQYTPDTKGLLGKRESWHVMTSTDGSYYGDCEDFALTIMWLHSDCNLLLFLWRLLINGKYKMHAVASTGGTGKVDHAVGSIDDVWFDNYTNKGYSFFTFIDATGHAYIHKISPFTAFSKLLVGLFLK